MNRASAAGLEAFTALLRALPPNTGMALVLVQLMDPKHESLLYQFLSKRMGAVEKASPCMLNSARVRQTEGRSRILRSETTNPGPARLRRTSDEPVYWLRTTFRRDLWTSIPPL
jgi:hypothetical protein